MSLWEDLIKIYPELTDRDFDPQYGTITLRDDADGFGEYIAKWEHDLTIPKGFKIGK